ncbi:hypothetical protein EBR66_06075 [bacterium]|nr:hypothetical protein [bacterium]
MQLKIGGEPPSELLLFTSRLIFVPAIVAFFLNRWGDVFIICFQAVCANWFHSSHTLSAFYADQVGMYLLAFHTLLLAITSIWTPFLFVLGFGYMLVVYSYGQCNSCFCFDSDPVIADRYHASIHILGIAIYASSMLFFLPMEAGGIFELIAW